MARNQLRPEAEGLAPLPPCLVQDYVRPCVWVSSLRGNVPPHAVCGGEDYCCVTYICRVCHCGDMVVGKLLPSHNCCYIAWKGAEYAYEEYEVLCNPDRSNLSWQWARDGQVPPGALQGGCTASGEKHYIGRHWHEGTVVIGSIVPSRNSLYISFGGKVYAYCDYEALVFTSVDF